MGRKWNCWKLEFKCIQLHLRDMRWAQNWNADRGNCTTKGINVSGEWFWQCGQKQCEVLGSPETALESMQTQTLHYTTLPHACFLAKRGLWLNLKTILLCTLTFCHGILSNCTSPLQMLGTRRRVPSWREECNEQQILTNGGAEETLKALVTVAQR